jgi:hypothetical protein
MVDLALFQQLLQGSLWTTPILWSLTDTSGEKVGTASPKEFQELYKTWYYSNEYDMLLGTSKSDYKTVGFIVRRDSGFADLSDSFVGSSKFILRFFKGRGIYTWAVLYHCPIQKQKYFPGTKCCCIEPQFFVAAFEVKHKGSVESIKSWADIKLEPLTLTLIREEDYHDLEHEKTRRALELEEQELADDPPTADIDNPVQ